MSIDIQPGIFHQGWIVVNEMAPWNHILSHGVHHIFNTGGCNHTLYRIYIIPKHWDTNNTYSTSIVTLLLGLDFIDFTATVMIGCCPYIMIIIWMLKTSYQSRLLNGIQRLVNLTPPPRSYPGLGKREIVPDKHHISVEYGIYPILRGGLLQQKKSCGEYESNKENWEK